MSLNLGSIQIPVNGATKTWAILAKRGAGKTYTAGVMAEEFFKNGVPFVVFDPIDVWYGLRFSSNGKDKGLPVVVFGLEHADIKLDRDMGRRIAQAVVRENVSVIISTFGLPKVAQRHLIAEFAEELMNINNTPRHIFIEEAHEFVPQRVQSGMGKVFSAVEALVVMGRNRGIGVTLINQRAATVNKDVLTQLDTLLAFQNVSPQDRKALKEWVEANEAEGDFDAFMDSLPSLPKGEGWIWSPEFMGIFQKIKIRKRETFHPDREKLGDKFEMPKLEQIDIQSFVEKFAQEEPIAQRDKRTPKKENDISFEPQPIKVYDPVRETAMQRAIIEMKNEYESLIIEKDARIRQLENTIRSAAERLGGGVHDASDIPAHETHVTNEANAMLKKLGGMPQKIYSLLLQHQGGLTKRQVALMCGYSVTGGSYSNALSKLRTMGLTSKDGEIYKALTR